MDGWVLVGYAAKVGAIAAEEAVAAVVVVVVSGYKVRGRRPSAADADGSSATSKSRLRFLEGLDACSLGSLHAALLGNLRAFALLAASLSDQSETRSRS